MSDDEFRFDAQWALGGHNPVVLIGPNGAGKSRFANGLSAAGGISMIPALRNIALQKDLPMRPLRQAEEQLRNHIKRRRQQPWNLAQEINELFSKLMAEDGASAMQFRDAAATARSEEIHDQPEIETTKLMRLQSVWSRLFPGRSISFAGYSPVVTSELSGAVQTYPAEHMSDGERVALYLAGRVLDADARVLIVDEPEVHFHSRLGTRFWSAMEELRDDLRFVYVTHDLPFALSRAGASYVLIMPNRQPQLIELDEGLPEELVESLLAAASFSIHAERIVFCEGVEATSLDYALYSAWFDSPGVAVMPANDARTVTESARTFDESDFVAGVTAIGIIDRDYWPDRYIEGLPDAVWPLRVHEVENLFCEPDVFRFVAKSVSVRADETEQRLEELIEHIRNTFTGDALDHQVSQRVQRRCEAEFMAALNSAMPIRDGDQLTSELDPTSWLSPPSEILHEERERLREALAGSLTEINAYLPGKTYLARAAQLLGLRKDRYVSIVCSELRGGGRQELLAALSEHLPPPLGRQS